ncbi:MAG: hypothetical protein KF855_03705 [Acidobacteria bacterium]|nr:hypothetical protein [Acidobacteriota bacterium]
MPLSTANFRLQMHSLDNNTPENARLSHPFSPKDSALHLRDHLIALAQKPENSSFKSILRSAAESIRVTAFGYNRATTKRKILRLLKEFHCLEILDIVDETNIKDSEIKAALAELVCESKIRLGKRRRWQEPGKHYNEIYELVIK